MGNLTRISIIRMGHNLVEPCKALTIQDWTRSALRGVAAAVGKERNRPLPLSFNSPVEGRFPGFTGELGWWLGLVDRHIAEAEPAMFATELKPKYWRIQTALKDPRAPERLLAHYVLERQLAEQLREAPAEERTRVAGEVYRRLLTELPDHPMNAAVSQLPRPERAARYLLPHLGRDVRFLEIGTGDGRLARYVASKCKSVLAIDVSDFLDPAADAPENFRFALTPGVAIDTHNCSIDLAFSNQLMEHLHPEDAAAQLREVYRVLRPGGLYICRTPNRTLGPSDISCYFDYVATGLHLKEYTFRELSELMKSTGFRSVRYRIEAAGRVWWAAPVRIMIVVESVYSFLPKGAREALKRNVIASILLGMSAIARK
jgi:SAM-dependent methyltransferase